MSGAWHQTGPGRPGPFTKQSQEGRCGDVHSRHVRCQAPDVSGTDAGLFRRPGPSKTWVIWRSGAARRFLGPRDPQPAGLRHGQVQLPLPLLHAGGGARVAPARRGPELRGDRAARRRARRDGRRRGAADRRRAARPARSARARLVARRDPRRARPLADDERRPARPARRARSSRPGFARLNVSLDSLSHVRFAEITRRDALDRVLAGLAEAERYPELRPIKVNCVAIRGFTEEEVPALAELARRKPYVVRFIEFMPLDADEAWREDEVLTGGEIRALIEERWPLVEIPAKAVLDGATLPLRRRRGRDRLRQPGLRAVLLELRPDPADRRRPAPHLPLLAARVGPEGAAPRRSDRRRARGAAPLRRPPQGAEAQDQRARASSARRGRCRRSAASELRTGRGSRGTSRPRGRPARVGGFAQLRQPELFLAQPFVRAARSAGRG